MTDEAIALRRCPPRVLADLLPRSWTRDLTLVVGAAVFVGVLAQAAVRLPFTPVPMTGQTLGVLLAGTALGWRRGMAALALYAAAGVAGVPWFAGHASGLVGGLFGYVIGFVLAAGACGWLAERGGGRGVWGSLGTMVAGEVVMYALGVTWLGLWYHFGVAQAVERGLVPFLAGDAVKMLLAAAALPTAWRAVGRSAGSGSRRSRRPVSRRAS